MELTRAKKQQPITSGGVPRVNLLPLAVAERRERSAMLREWLIRIGGTVVLVGVVCAGLFAWQMVTMARQAAVATEGENLLLEIAAKSEIQGILNEDTAVTAYRDEAAATRLGWSDALARIKSALPAGAWVCAFDLAAGGTPSEDPLTSAGLSGTVQVCGVFASASRFLNALAAVDGVMSAQAISAQQDGEGGVFNHTIAITLDQRVYSKVGAEATEVKKAGPDPADTPEPSTEPEPEPSPEPDVSPEPEPAGTEANSASEEATP